MLHLSLTTIGDNACSLLIMPSEPCASSVNKPSHLLAYMSYMLRCGIWLVGAPECIAVYALMPPAVNFVGLSSQTLAASVIWDLLKHRP